MARLHAALAWTVTLVLLLPILWMAATAVKPAGEYVSTSIALLPQAPTGEHFRELWRGDLAGKVANSLVVTVGAVALSLAAGMPAAYALVRFGLPRRLDAAFLLFVLLVKLAPPLVLAIPLYQVLHGLGLIDTLAGLVLVYQVYTLPFAIWILIGFVRDLPPAYEEAAEMDGAGLAMRLVTIVLPLIAPGIVATAILLAILAWNEFAYAMLFIQSPARFTLPTYIATLITEDETFWGRLSAIGLVASVPILVLLAVFQRHLIRGLGGGLK